MSRKTWRLLFINHVREIAVRIRIFETCYLYKWLPSFWTIAKDASCVLRHLVDTKSSLVKDCQISLCSLSFEIEKFSARIVTKAFSLLFHKQKNQKAPHIRWSWDRVFKIFGKVATALDTLWRVSPREFFMKHNVCLFWGNKGKTYHNPPLPNPKLLQSEFAILAQNVPKYL